jgi:hypothetical protein
MSLFANGDRPHMLRQRRGAPAVPSSGAGTRQARSIEEAASNWQDGRSITRLRAPTPFFAKVTPQ